MLKKACAITKSRKSKKSRKSNAAKLPPKKEYEDFPYTQEQLESNPEVTFRRAIIRQRIRRFVRQKENLNGTREKKNTIFLLKDDIYIITNFRAEILAVGFFESKAKIRPPQEPL